jgi:hypothetical protein
MVTHIETTTQIAEALKSVGKEVEVVDVVVTQRMETNEHRDFKEFLVPTAQALERFIHRGSGDCLSTPTDEQNNHFARLLNQGSSLE